MKPIFALILLVYGAVWSADLPRSIIEKDDFEDALKAAGDQLVVAEFSATWCGPCRTIGPHFEALAKDDAYKSVIFLKIDVDEVEELAEEFGIPAMPTFIFFKNCEKVDEMSGANREKLTELLAKHM